VSVANGRATDVEREWSRLICFESISVKSQGLTSYDRPDVLWSEPPRIWKRLRI